MNIIPYIGAALVSAVLGLILKQYKPEYNLYISLVCSLLILTAVVGAVKTVIETITILSSMVNVDKMYGQVLIKSIGICYLTELAADTCKDSGETAIAKKIELLGKVAILLLTLPLFMDIVDIVTKLIG